MRRIFALSIIISSLLFGMPGPLAAQETEHTTVGGFETTGSITAGYRFTDISGRREKFAELFSLRSGFRLHDISLVGTAIDNQRFADSYTFAASGIG